MRIVHAAVLASVLSWSAAAAQEPPKIENRKDRISYSVGYQVGGDFRKQGMDINAEVLVQGIRDALEKKEPLISRDTMREILVDLKKTILDAQTMDRMDQARENLEKGRAFLEKNAKVEGVVSLKSGLQYKVLQEGSGVKPVLDDTVTVQYTGSLVDGTVVDGTSGTGKAATFRAGSTIAGWKEALPLMKEGARWLLFIPSELAYGEGGAGRIGPNSTLIYEVELVSVENAEEAASPGK